VSWKPPALSGREASAGSEAKISVCYRYRLEMSPKIGRSATISCMLKNWMCIG